MYSLITILVCSNNESGKKWKLAQERHGLVIFNHKLDANWNLSNRLYTNENPPHFIHEIKTIAYDVMDVIVVPRTLMRFPRKKGLKKCILYYCSTIVI